MPVNQVGSKERTGPCEPTLAVQVGQAPVDEQPSVFESTSRLIEVCESTGRTGTWGEPEVTVFEST